LLELFAIFDRKAKDNKTPLYIHRDLSDKQTTIKTDKVKLSKILNNLIDNA
jgi:signal transduction histidine kinase